MKCALPLKTRQQEEQGLVEGGKPLHAPLCAVHLIPDGREVRIFATPHAKRRWSSESPATLPEGALGE